MYLCNDKPPGKQTMKKVVLAMDSFKGCLTSEEANEAAASGIASVCPACQCICFPVADGGEGFLRIWLTDCGGDLISLQAHNPCMELIRTHYGISGDRKTALIEMALVSGLPLISPEKRNPMQTTSYGTGELIKDALDRGCRQFIIGIGGSATNDAGTGMLQALGFRFFDKEGKELSTGGKIMAQVARIDTNNAHPALQESHFTIACDVNNPFNGPQGAACIFARQKGADNEMIRTLDTGMHSIAKVFHQTTGKEITSIPGAGAAGGIGGAFLAFLNATLQPGSRLLLDQLRFSEKITGADLVITGEGQTDRQTLMGKIPSAILSEASQQQIPVILITGNITDMELLQQAGFAGIFSITPGILSPEQAMQPEVAKKNIQQTVSQLTRLIRTFRN